jgi:hypothetical protein
VFDEGKADGLHLVLYGGRDDHFPLALVKEYLN